MAAVPCQRVLMGIVTAWRSLTSIQVASVLKQEGVYELADSSRATIYIGQSKDLNSRLQALLTSNDPFWRHAANFRCELTSRSEQRRRERLEEYFQKHGRYPPCN